jgi:signal transduction histidine kinase
MNWRRRSGGAAYRCRAGNAADCTEPDRSRAAEWFPCIQRGNARGRAGEGTGLGLSMGHDIVVKQHGGTIDVATEPGAFTEIVLPRRSNSSNK